MFQQYVKGLQWWAVLVLLVGVRAAQGDAAKGQ